MKYYCYNELNQEDLQIISDEDILARYWDTWCAGMKRVGKESQISEEACVADWCVVHWAWPLKKTGES